MPHFIKSKFTDPIPLNPSNLPNWLASNCRGTDVRDVKITFTRDYSNPWGLLTAHYQVKDLASEDVKSFFLLKVWLSDSTTLFRAGTQDLIDETASHLKFAAGAADFWLVTNSNGHGRWSWKHESINMDSVLSSPGNQDSNKKSISAEFHANLYGGPGGIKTATGILTNGWAP